MFSLSTARLSHPYLPACLAAIVARQVSGAFMQDPLRMRRSGSHGAGPQRSLPKSEIASLHGSLYEEMPSI